MSLEAGVASAPSAAQPAKPAAIASYTRARAAGAREERVRIPAAAVVPPAASPSSAPAPEPAPRWPRWLAGAALLLAAAAFALRRRARLQSNEVLAVAAHELKSPLAALESYLALMQQEGKAGGAADTRAWLEDVGHMRTTAAHLRRTIGDILEMTRLDDARIKLEPRPMDLAESARRSAEAFRALAAESRIELTLRAGPAPAWGDPTRARQILDNLVANALRHAPESGTVTVSTGSDGSGRAWCEVTDDGKGVPQAGRARLFTRFARLSPPLRGEPGTGLGLYIGRALARAQGGDLEYASGPAARGARFRLTLPSTRDA